ncbi:MAG: hypothetical protein K9G83_07930 [Hyphomonadaceae bacterium]|nr:hypothetical protein [Hyphomonadaceae bacterium]
MRRVVSAIALALIAPLALAQTTRTFTYDEHGRLTKVDPSSGLPVCYGYDKADNRVAVSAVAGCAAGSWAVNSPPQATDDVIYVYSFSDTRSLYLSVLSNDTDYDLPGDTLTVTSVSGSPYASVVSGGSDIFFNGFVGTYTLSYAIKDQANATSSATVYLEIIRCYEPECEL